MASKRLSQEEIANQKAERIMNGVATWCSYYRANPHRFCKDYLGLNLKLFQKILIFMMNISDAFMFIAARGLGKTYLTAIYCCVRAILYPGTIICIASGARSQAVGVLEKITNLLMPDSGNLRFEIETSVINQQMAFIKFKNSSMIKVVTAADSARGNRAHIIIVDEFRLVSREVIDKVLKKFLTARRHPKFLDKPEYKNLPKEENKQIYMSSAWYKSHWSYDKLRAFSANMLDDTKQYFACGFPYQLSVKEDLLSLRSVEDDMSESDFNELIQEQNCDEVLHTVRGYDSLDFIDKLQFKLPYINTSLLVNELVNLQYETKNNVVRVFEKTGFRKDRYSSLSYNYWIIKQLELKLNRPKHELDFKSGYFCFRRPKIK